MYNAQRYTEQVLSTCLSSHLWSQVPGSHLWGLTWEYTGEAPKGTGLLHELRTALTTEALQISEKSYKTRSDCIKVQIYGQFILSF